MFSKPMPLELKREVNQLAHRLAITYESEARRTLLAQAKQQINEGTPMPVIERWLINVEFRPVSKLLI